MFNQYPIGKRFYLDLFPIAAVYFSTLPFDKLKPAQANLSFYALLLIALVPFFAMRHPSKFPFRIEPARETANYLKQHSVDTVYIDKDVDISPSLKFYAPGLQHVVVDDAGKVPANAVFISKIDDSLAKDPRFTVDTTFNYPFGVMILTRK